MRNRFLILTVVMATLFACNSDSMSNDDFNETAEKRKSVPFKIKKLEGTFTIGGGDPASCGPNFLMARGEGTISHLGKSMLLEDWCFDITIPNDDGTKRRVTFIAANGDELYSNDGTVIWTSPFSFVEEFKFDGGTGRFENAQGTFTEYVDIVFDSPTTGTFILSSEGTLKY